MIGDANGTTSETVNVSIDNPFIERYVTLLNNLQPLEGHWGVVFDSYDLENYVSEKQITQDDYDFLYPLMFDSDYEFPKELEEWASEFVDGIQGETEYSFLVFEGIKITYVEQ